MHWQELQRLVDTIILGSANVENKEDINYVYSLVSERIKYFRKKRNLTQEELAEKTYCSRGFIGNIESQKTSQTFSLSTIYSFARALDIPLELFVKEDINEELIYLGFEAPLSVSDNEFNIKLDEDI